MAFLQGRNAACSTRIASETNTSSARRAVRTCAARSHAGLLSQRPVSSTARNKAVQAAQRSFIPKQSIVWDHKSRRCASVRTAAVGGFALPEGVGLEINSDESETQIEYNQDTKTVKIPLNMLGDSSRRSKLVLFTCNQCGGRTGRLVNPIAWDKGVVFGQCAHCEMWHTLASNNKQILEEIRYDREGDDAAAAAAATAATAPGDEKDGTAAKMESPDDASVASDDTTAAVDLALDADGADSQAVESS